jgi:hypothetical protein
VNWEPIDRVKNQSLAKTQSRMKSQRTCKLLSQTLDRWEHQKAQWHHQQVL